MHNILEHVTPRIPLRSASPWYTHRDLPQNVDYAKVMRVRRRGGGGGILNYKLNLF